MLEDKSFIIETILYYFPDVSIYAFGSRINGGAERYSDLDIALKADKPLPLSQWLLLEEAFSESDLPYKIDVVDFNRVTTAFQEIINNTSECWHSSK